MSRIPIRTKKLRDGFYIEVRNKGSKEGIRLIREDRIGMLKAGSDYRKSKDVIILGEYRDGKWVSKNE
jgi:hypothetical protein